MFPSPDPSVLWLTMIVSLFDKETSRATASETASVFEENFGLFVVHFAQDDDVVRIGLDID